MTACRRRTPTTVTGIATRRPAVEQQAPIPPAHHHPQTPAVTMIHAGPTTGPAMTIRRTATARILTPTPTHPPAAIPPAPARSWMRPPAAGTAKPAHPRPISPPRNRPGTKPCTRRPVSPRPRESCRAPSRRPEPPTSRPSQHRRVRQHRSCQHGLSKHRSRRHSMLTWPR